MRYAKDHKADTRARIVKNASVALRERGPGGIGVAELMQDTGLTHGGFYAHFKSRDALIEEAFEYALSQISRRWRKRADDAAPGEALDAIVSGYLTPEHRDNVGQGCVLPALGAEIARATPKTRKAYARKLEDMIELISEQIGAPPDEARAQAIGIIATMMGGLLLSRGAGKTDMSKEILDAAKSAALGAGGKEPPARRKSPKRGH